MGIPARVVLDGEGHDGLLPGGSDHLVQHDVDARNGSRVLGNHVRADDGSVEIQLALRNMASGALGIVHFRQAHPGEVPWFRPVAKLMLEWQPPQAARSGWVIQRLL